MRQMVSATLIGAFLLMSPGCLKTAPQESPAGPQREDASYWLDKALAEVEQIDLSGDGDDAPLRAVLMACSDLGEYDTYKRIVADLPAELGGTFYVLLVRDQMARGEVEQAGQTAELAPTDEARHLGRALIALETSNHDLAEGIRLAKGLAEGELRQYVFLHICELQVIAGDMEAAKVSATEAHNSAEIMVFAGQIATGEFDEPSYEDKTGDTFWNIVEMSLVKIIKSRADQGDFDGALELTEMMVFPDSMAAAHLAIAEASLDAGLEDDYRRSMEQAESDLAVALENENLAIFSIRSMVAMAQLHMKAGDIDTAIETMQRAGEEFAASDDDIKGLIISGLDDGSALIEMLLAADRLDEARALAETEDGVIDETYRVAFILAFARTGQQAQAEQLTESARTPAQRAIYYSALARGLAAREDGELDDSP